MDGELPAAEVVRCAAQVLRHESAASVVEPILGLAAQVADYWAPVAERDGLLADVADVALLLADDPEHRVGAVRALARTATTGRQLGRLQALADTPDLRWRRLVRMAELDRLDDAEVERLSADDPDPECWASALTARAARPHEPAKEEAWRLAFVDRAVPPGSLGVLGRAFWRPGQDELLTPYADRFLEGLPEMGRSGMLWALSLAMFLFPTAGGDAQFPERLEAATDEPDVSPIVRQQVREYTDQLRRMRAARGRR
jgi:aminopeptidase N